MDATQLSDEQKKTIAKWAEEGCGLSEIQKRLAEELNIRLSFMDLRFLVLDLGLKIKERFSRAEASAGGDVPMQAEEALEGEPEYEAEPPRSGGGVSVEVDRIKKPGAILSGTVVFSDGVRAAWMLDQYGRVALDAGRPGYRPAAEELSAFQKELSRKLQTQGF